METFSKNPLYVGLVGALVGGNPAVTDLVIVRQDKKVLEQQFNPFAD